MKDLSQYKQQFNMLKGFKIYDCVLLIGEWPFILCIPEDENTKKLIVLIQMISSFQHV